MRIFYTSFLAIVVVFSTACTHASSSRVFSDVHVVPDSEDVIGTELTISVVDQLVTGTVRHFEGGNAEEVAVTGTLDGEHLVVTGSHSEGSLIIDGRIVAGELIGELRFNLPGQTNAVPLRLHPRPRRD